MHRITGVDNFISEEDAQKEAEKIMGHPIQPIKHLKFDGKVVFDSNKPEGILKKNTDNTVFKNTFLDFTFTSLDDGLGLTIQDFIKNYNILRK